MIFDRVSFRYVLVGERSDPRDLAQRVAIVRILDLDTVAATTSRAARPDIPGESQPGYTLC